MSASDVIARLRELRANALNGDWFEEGHGIIAPDEATIVGSPWVAANVHWSSRPAIVAAMNSLPALLDAAEALEAALRALDLYEVAHDQDAGTWSLDTLNDAECLNVEAASKARLALQALAPTGENNA